MTMFYPFAETNFESEKVANRSEHQVYRKRR